MSSIDLIASASLETFNGTRMPMRGEATDLTPAAVAQQMRVLEKCSEFADLSVEVNDKAVTGDLRLGAPGPTGVRLAEIALPDHSEARWIGVGWERGSVRDRLIRDRVRQRRRGARP